MAGVYLSEYQNYIGKTEKLITKIIVIISLVSISLRSKRSRASEVLLCVGRERIFWRRAKDSGRAKIGARAKKGKERGGGWEARERLQANPTILKNAHRFFRLISLVD